MRPSRAQPRSRVAGHRPLPPTRYLPGVNPRPSKDAGRHPGAAPRPAGPPDPERWEACEAHLYGIDLFNHGYCWEAHAVWEELWQACGRRGVTATFLKGLIALAAAGLKARMGNARGTRTHATRAVDFFQAVADRSPEPRYMGLHLEDLERHARAIASRPPAGTAKQDSIKPFVFEFVLWPD